MDLLRLAISLGLPMDGAQFTGDWSLDVDPVFGIPFRNGLPWAASATTLPGFVLYDDSDAVRDGYGGRNHLPSNPEILRHELEHSDQMGALGPAFWLGYGGTAGRAFEPYDIFNLGAPNASGNPHDFSNAWTAPEEMRGQYPLFRVSRMGGETQFRLLPGYPGVSFETQVR